MRNEAKTANQDRGQDEVADFSATVDYHGSSGGAVFAIRCFKLGDGIQAVKGKFRICNPFRTLGLKKFCGYLLNREASISR
jgi:hypothetical protein